MYKYQQLYSEQKTNSKPKTTLYNRVSISNTITGGMDEPEREGCVKDAT